MIINNICIENNMFEPQKEDLKELRERVGKLRRFL